MCLSGSADRLICSQITIKTIVQLSLMIEWILLKEITYSICAKPRVQSICTYNTGSPSANYITDSVPLIWFSFDDSGP